MILVINTYNNFFVVYYYSRLKFNYPADVWGSAVILANMSSQLKPPRAFEITEWTRGEFRTHLLVMTRVR